MPEGLLLIADAHCLLWQSDELTFMTAAKINVVMLNARHAGLHLVAFRNKGTPIKTPIYYHPYYGDPENGAPNFGEPPFSHKISPA